ncbi:hypothetical protein WJX72_012117 [[Myrmecia] bisecta]|uniref:Vacuolar cation/proton exchanger n=1 Tax=[Myrmecia] bisecta TaxID=41462 RepID=A0AAW1PL44_9CHLO
MQGPQALAAARAQMDVLLAQVSDLQALMQTTQDTQQLSSWGSGAPPKSPFEGDVENDLERALLGQDSLASNPIRAAGAADPRLTRLLGDNRTMSDELREVVRFQKMPWRMLGAIPQPEPSTSAVPTAAPSSSQGCISALGRDMRAVANVLASSWINVLLICLPLGIICAQRNWGALPTFILNFAALVPLALLLGEVTEDLAMRFGDVVGGLLNATFGNVVEVILSITALRKGLYGVVASSLLGSILSNLLLVLGCCFLCGGMRYQQQSFSALVNKAGCSLLFLACIALAMPTAARSFYGDAMMTQAVELQVSHIIAILLMAVYLLYLLFQLKTHGHLFDSEEEGEAGMPNMSCAAAFAMLIAISFTVALSSEYLTDAIEDVSLQTGLHEDFLALILLPIAGNACEHITAVSVAMKNKMGLAIGVALGSSIQIAVFVIPLVTLVGWGMGTDFTLDFDPFCVLMLTMAVIIAYFVSSDGSSNWLAGVQLTVTYFLIATLFLFRGDADDNEDQNGLLSSAWRPLRVVRAGH